MRIEDVLKDYIQKGIVEIFKQQVELEIIQIQSTKEEFIGDFTLVVFPLLRLSKKSPEETAQLLGEYLKNNCNEVADYNVIKGFLNLSLTVAYWINYLNSLSQQKSYYNTNNNSPKSYMIEYSSPNTNKPLHLGHIRNNLLGYSVSKILEANGNKVIKVNLVNDRGIHICKSMLAWMLFGNNETPEYTGKKGDHLVGDYYVKFDKKYKAQVAELISKGNTEEEAKANAPILKQAQEMLRNWEAGNNEVLELWKTMNEWVFKGFDETYKRLGVSFDKIYYESETYLLGKKKVLEGLEKNVFYKKEDGSIWVDLTNEGLDNKLLIRNDGTTVYITQDIGTAIERVQDYNFDEMIYVVGNEQEYHFQVLSKILDKLGFSWAKNLTHLSYGMVELPSGKMKSREGTVVDADDLMDTMTETAKEMSDKLGKLDGYNEQEKEKIFETIGLGALKYFILKVDPKKNMVFNPEESIDFNGNTGPFIQYTYARILSVLRKASEQKLIDFDLTSKNIELSKKELQIIKILYAFPTVLSEAAKFFSPALVANYVYDLAKNYNQFYHDYSILKEGNIEIKKFRLLLTKISGNIIQSAMNVLGIEVPERM